MKFSLTIAALASLAVTAAYMPNHIRRGNSTANYAYAPNGIQPPASAVSRDAFATDCKTNAECLRMGQPINPAKTRTLKARQARASDIRISGSLRVRDTAGAELGFVGTTRNIYGEYGFGDDQDTPLQVSFSISGGSSQINVEINDPAYPFLGYTMGYASPNDDMSEGEFNYAFLTGVAESTGRGVVAQPGNNSFSDLLEIPKSSQTAIWTYDESTRTLTPTWINTDGSRARTASLYYNRDNVLVQTGDQDMFTALFGDTQAAILYVQ